ncbi:hypothetical protein COCMIDRAFT_108904 [Bipolaris oryzae ATCC 44560]|uniref:Uncharacterized protein n=1 Tax=Bipolaris oryzae ATCC 44560 TaxID=930090 RepID=W6YXW0_COCMI|nr:uncharacterized protein COCMIDRAFT_108904 [Bipolaris oryzae ATCC 44560]EUC40404.1 hypothetical protein COCMIDRAFT_108904 [Bipolaris oryzae ATCC 44560]
MATRYDSVGSTKNEPMKALNAVSEPAYTAPVQVIKMPYARVEESGLCHCELTAPILLANGVAPSRPSA